MWAVHGSSGNGGRPGAGCNECGLYMVQVAMGEGLVQAVMYVGCTWFKWQWGRPGAGCNECGLYMVQVAMGEGLMQAVMYVGCTWFKWQWGKAWCKL